MIPKNLDTIHTDRTLDARPIMHDELIQGKGTLTVLREIR